MPKNTSTSLNANAESKTSKSTKNEKADKKQGSVKVTTKDAKKLKNNIKGSDEDVEDIEVAPKAKQSIGKNKRMAGIVKGSAPNAGTAYINGTFNVNLARKELKKYIKNTLGLELGTINAQYPYTAIAEILALYIIRSSGKFSTKSAKKADLYEVTLENMRRAIRESSDFGADLKSLSEAFNPTAMNYTTTFFDTEKTLCEFLEHKAFTNTSNVHINHESLNFVCYMLSHTLANLTKTSCYLSLYAKKKNVQIKNFRFACNIHFSGELNELMTQRLGEIESLFANNKEGVDVEDGEEKSSDKGKKASKEEAKDDDDEDEIEEEEEEDEDEEVEEEEDDEEE